MLKPEIVKHEAPSPRTTIAQIVWDHAPQLGFRGLVNDMVGALDSTVAAARAIDWSGEDQAVIDFGGSRVAMGVGRAADGPLAMTVTVGYAPTGDSTRLAENQTLLARLIVQRITSHFPAARVVWSHSMRHASHAMLAELVASPSGTPGIEEADAAPTERAARARHFARAEDLPRFFDTLETALVTRRAGGRPLPAPTEPEVPADRPRRNRMRLAAHLLDASLLIVAFPVGAAMMIWSLARGADITTSARAVAVIAVVLTAAQSFDMLRPLTRAVALGL